MVCSTVNNSPTCVDSKCTFNCANGFTHCGSPQNNTGCETNIRTVNNCGACGVMCTTAQVVFANGVACTPTGTCTYTSCMQGHVDDDDDATNGCEETCGGRLETCCPNPQMRCNNGDQCKQNGSCPN